MLVSESAGVVYETATTRCDSTRPARDETSWLLYNTITKDSVSVRRSVGRTPSPVQSPCRCSPYTFTNPSVYRRRSLLAHLTYHSGFQPARQTRWSTCIAHSISTDVRNVPVKIFANVNSVKRCKFKGKTTVRIYLRQDVVDKHDRNVLMTTAPAQNYEQQEQHN